MTSFYKSKRATTKYVVIFDYTYISFVFSSHFICKVNHQQPTKPKRKKRIKIPTTIFFLFTSFQYQFYLILQFYFWILQCYTKYLRLSSVSREYFSRYFMLWLKLLISFLFSTYQLLFLSL